MKPAPSDHVSCLVCGRPLEPVKARTIRDSVRCAAVWVFCSTKCLRAYDEMAALEATGVDPFSGQQHVWRGDQILKALTL